MTLDRSESSVTDEGCETLLHSGTRCPSLGFGNSAASLRDSHIETLSSKPIDGIAHDDDRF